MDQINQTLEALIKKLDSNPLQTIGDVRQLSVDLADQHFYVEKKLRLIGDELEQVEWLLFEMSLQPHVRKGLSRCRDELVKMKRATVFALAAYKKLAEDSDKIYYDQVGKS
jgi:Mg2+ and Co2+ transporter CorA